MSEPSLFIKLSTQLKGFLHDAADNMEDPGRTARQLVRDLDSSIGQAEEQIVSVRAEFNLMSSKRDGEQAQIDKYTGYAMKAIERSDDALAKEALTEKAKHVAQHAAYQAQIDMFKPNLDHLDEQIGKLRAKKEEMERKTDLIEARSATADATNSAASILGGIGDSVSAAERFERLESKVAKKEAEAGARAQMAASRNGDELKDKFAALDAPTSNVDADLAALKAQMGKTQ